MIEQISVFAENTPGRLAMITNVLKENGINMSALTIAETGEFGIIRFISNDSEKAYKVLHDNGFTVTRTNVLAIEMENVPGSLADIANILGDNGVNIEYCYAFAIQDKSKAVLVLKIDDQVKGMEILEGAERRLLHARDIS